ncbi:MAG: adenosylcobinamide-GDP ribazoletransferase [Pseudomonadota bacterium]
MTSFWLSLQFLTRLPTPHMDEVSAQQVGRSLAWYPLVGLLLGAILWGAGGLLQGQEPLLAAAILLALWVGLSGALHLDGLADSADAWVGGLGDRERTLAIMKDPTSGPIGVSVLVLLLLLKFAALVALLRGGELLPLLLLPALARSSVALLFVTTPYVRPGGLGEALSQYAPRGQVIGGAAVLMLLLLGLLAWSGLAAMAGAVLLWFWLRYRVMRRLGGFTGDIAGALLELTECIALLVIVLFSPHL